MPAYVAAFLKVAVHYKSFFNCPAIHAVDRGKPIHTHPQRKKKNQQKNFFNPSHINIRLSNQVQIYALLMYEQKLYFLKSIYFLFL